MPRSCRKILGSGIRAGEVCGRPDCEYHPRRRGWKNTKTRPPWELMIRALKRALKEAT